jgi:WD40 repeat protein
MSKIKHLKKNTLFFLFVILSLFSLIIFSGCIDIYERSSIEFLEISADGSKLISYDYAFDFQIWNITTAEELYRNRFEIGNVLWLDKGNEFLVTGSNQIRIFNASSFKEIWNHSGTFSYIDVKSYATTVSTSFMYYKDQQPFFNISLWNLSNRAKIKVLNITTSNNKISLSQTATHFVYIPTEGSYIKIVNLSDEHIVQKLPLINHSVLNISRCHYLNWIENDSVVVMVAYFKNQGTWLYYWNVTDGSVVCNKMSDFMLINPSFSADATILINSDISDNTNISIVNTFSGEVLHRLFVSEKGVSSTTCSPDGRFIAAGSNDGIIKIWNSSTGELIQTLMTPKNYIVPL